MSDEVKLLPCEDLVRDLIPFLGNIAQMLDEMKTERQYTNGRGLPWTPYNQDQRDTLTAFLQRAHDLAHAAIEATRPPIGTDVEEQHDVQPSGIDPRYGAPESITSTHSDACLEEPASDPNCPRCADLREFRAAIPPIGTDEVVERVARAIAKATGTYMPILSPQECPRWTYVAATAAIAAMKDAASD